tara:strand:+ start:1695 stop:2000 length:306 start_codon:yes stop_codon:yes gene_type:complete
MIAALFQYGSIKGMISSDTTHTFLTEFEKLCKEDPAHTLSLIADFCQLEPNFAAFMVMLHGKPMLTDPVAIGLLSAVLYRRLRESQDKSDELSEGIGDADK